MHRLYRDDLSVCQPFILLHGHDHDDRPAMFGDYNRLGPRKIDEFAKSVFGVFCRKRLHPNPHAGTVLLGTSRRVV